jgi:hypothetical protein
VSLPPLANFFAVYSADPAWLRDQQAAWSNQKEFSEVWAPAPGWIVGWAPLPNSAPEPEAIRKNAFVFAEGSHAITASAQEPTEIFFGTLAETVDQKPERLAQYPGDYTFLRFRFDGSLTAVRACAGLAPLYYHRANKRIAIGTRLGFFVRYLGLNRLDPLVNGIWSGGNCFFPDGRTLLVQVSCLARGSLIKFGAKDRPQPFAYWFPRSDSLPRPSPALELDHAQTLRELLLSKLDCDLQAEGGNLLTLSGGVDSASVAALARGVLDRPIMSWSLLPEPADLYENEMSFIQPLRDQYGFQRIWEERMTVENRMASLANLRGALFPILHPALLALPKILEEAEIQVLVGAEFADEVCGSHFTLDDWAAMASLLRLCRQVVKREASVRDLLRLAKQKLIRCIQPRRIPFVGSLPDFIAPEICAEYQAWRQQKVSIATRDCRPKYYFALCHETAEWVTMNWEALSLLRIHRALPFFNREVIELAFRCHPEELVVPGTKKLLRRALHNDVPGRNLYRASKGAWGSHLKPAQCSWRKELPDLLAGVVRQDWISRSPDVLPYSLAGPLSYLAVFADSVQRASSKGAPLSL